MSYLVDLELMKAPVTPSLAATVILVRDTKPGEELEVFAVERNKNTRFMGGNIVFPGGKLDAEDAAAGWNELTTDPLPWPEETPGGSDRALAVCACRETLEEAGLFIVDGTVDDAAIAALRAQLSVDGTALSQFLRAHGLRLTLDRMIPFARWVTPSAEPRRFDTRFFLARAPAGQTGVHDDKETVSSVWATPSSLLARYHRDEVQLAAPTYRSLEQLAAARDVATAETAARAAVLRPVCPEMRLLGNEGDAERPMVLCLPGDPLHSVNEVRSVGATRFVQEGRRWVPQR